MTPVAPHIRHPFIHAPGHSEQLAWQTLRAALPGTILAIFWLGYGLLLNLFLAGLLALFLTSLLTLLPGRQRSLASLDCLGLLPALLLALLLPPAAPWWLIGTGLLFTIALRVAFGGPGQLLFHTAMAGYLFVRLLFPEQFPGQFADTAGQPLSFNLDALRLALAQTFSTGASASTALVTSSTLFSPPAANVALPALLTTLAFAGGGLYLLWRGVVKRRIPVTILLVYGLCGLIDSEILTAAGFLTPLLLSGPIVLAFFIAPEPATSPVTARGQFLYAILIGLFLAYLQPSGDLAVAAASTVLFANFWGPLLDRFGRPRVIGHKRVTLPPPPEAGP